MKTASFLPRTIGVGICVLIPLISGCTAGDTRRREPMRSAMPVALPDRRASGAFDPARGREVALHDTFSELRVGPGQPWGWKSGAYPGCVTNPGNFKLDALSAKALRVSSGALTITASQQRSQRWRTGLITTGDSCGSGGRGFMVRTGDVITARVKLPSTSAGAWPGIWTWRHGGNEIDLFEWHADRQDTLEFVNHPRRVWRYLSNSQLIQAGRWMDVSVHLGERNVRWYVGIPPGKLRPVFSDKTGVGRRFAAYLVIGLSVDDGRLHAAPRSSSPFSFRVASVTVHRPA
ncbi:hypothetical protein OIE66_22040 [Nonomuraea sp. NBC_01738]|uniref:hypothetical protein n=1 Tax=Nonomuraea sp. NBC_01738 TaxID=2976003 RepID=UPI002E1011FE|nr:hypothetical protein OIE66_22040 [Nonomuraea sp. NBC_01738]